MTALHILGFAFGFAFIGALFLLYRWLIKPRCPECRGRIPVGATRCLHCAISLANPAAPAFKLPSRADFKSNADYKLFLFVLGFSLFIIVILAVLEAAGF